jgi:uncharacterized protein YlxP (DUF503 family)
MSLFPEDVSRSEFLAESPMAVGLLTVQLFLPDAQNLKDKRSAVKSLKDQLRHRFNVAIIEVEANTKWQRATLGLSTVGMDRSSVDECLRQVVQWVEEHRFVQVVRVQHEVL